LPNGTGKDVRVAVFAESDQAREAEEAGADLIGGADLAEAMQSGKQALDFDVVIAVPSMMSVVGKLGPVLGPRGLMPNPKSGTVTQDVGKTVEAFKAGRVEYRNDRYGNVHLPIGRVSFEADALLENLAAASDEILRARPASAKGRFMRGATISSTMGPGVKIETGLLEDLVKERR
jgi:large subunit ribosomal protein L1